MQNYSRQREAIVRTLANTVSHPTAEEIYAEVKKNCPKISLATVYRNLRMLAKEGEVLVLHTSDDKEHYDGTVTPHAHLCCPRCGKVSDLPLDAELIKALSETQPKAKFELNFYSLCKDCRNN